MSGTSLASGLASELARVTAVCWTAILLLATKSASNTREAILSVRPNITDQQQHCVLTQLTDGRRLSDCLWGPEAVWQMTMAP